MTSTTYEPGEPDPSKLDDLPTEVPDLALDVDGSDNIDASVVAESAGEDRTGEDVDPTDPASEPTD